MGGGETREKDPPLWHMYVVTAEIWKWIRDPKKMFLAQ